MTTWPTGEPSQQWPPASGRPPAHGPAAPVPPTVAWLAAAVAAVTAVLLVVLLTTDTVADLLRDAGLVRADATVLAALVGVLGVCGLLGGAIGVLTGRGAGLLRIAGAAVAVVVVLLVAVALVVAGDLEVIAVLGGPAVALGAGATSALATSRVVAGWSHEVERRSAERELAALTVGSRSSLPARGVESLVLAVVLVLGTVLTAVVTTSALAPDLAEEAGAAAGTSSGASSGGSVAEEEGSSSSDGAEPVPVDPGDPDFDTYFDRLADECAAGDLERCDDLYLETPVDSDYESYGSTCGGRAGIEYYGECNRLFD